jgi:hypothetical protein
MSNFKLCPNGHQYPEAATECPYCPKGNPTPALSNLDKTQVVGGGSPPVPSGLVDKTQVLGGGANLPPSGGNLGKTQIVSPGQQNISAGQTVHLRQQNGRKLVGWLVSFTLDPLGVDFKLYEGRNLIGSDSRCDIVVSDGSISGHHLTILYRMGTYKFKDEMSSNGTFVNDQFDEEGNLEDGDVIRIGNTLFLFRAAR